MCWKKFEDTKGITRSRNSKKIQQDNQRKKDKITNNDLQNTI